MMTLREKSVTVGLILLALCKLNESKGLCDFDRVFPNSTTEGCAGSRSLPTNEEVICSEGNLPVISEGFFNCSGHSSGDVCNLTCNDGFYPPSSNQTICEENGKRNGEWKDGNFTCTEVTCDLGELPDVQNGSFKCSGHSHGDVCNLTCSNGFYSSSSSQTMCEGKDKGEWKGGNFTCAEIVCDVGKLPIVHEGYFNCSGYSRGDICNLTCNDGFYPTSSNQTQCTDEVKGHGEWQHGNFTCTEIVCDSAELPIVYEGSFNCSGYSSGDVCSLTCNDGLFPFSSNETICEGNDKGGGQWKDANYTCTEIICDVSELPIVHEGYFNCSGYSRGDICNLTCNDGFHPSSSNQTLCEDKFLHKGEWKRGNYTCAECPAGYQHSFSGSCYNYVHELVASRSSARLACESQSAHLAFIDNEAEVEFLLKYTENGTYYWFGYNGQMNHSFWEDGSNITFQGLLSELSKKEEIPDCMILTNQMGELVFLSEKELHYSCHDLVGFICEYEAHEDLIPTRCPPDMAICNDDWLDQQWSWESEIPGLQLAFYDGNPVSTKPLQLTNDFHHLIYSSDSSWCSLRISATEVCLDWIDWGNSSYAFSSISVPWEDAAEICKIYDAHLIFITSEEEQNFARSSIILHRYSWVGVTHKEQTGDWQWGSVTAAYDYFEEYSENAEPCPEIWSLDQQSDYHLHFYPCHFTNPFTCEREYGF
ncbi:E-selectin [Holothuria leucospilota]|uniref:E-selectin n=1 Tax=Holothuria leucospilota TaxID=206669 RepID=A0A9Q1BEL0_HOLLE|nr:E-selectin [Holothuria leucospilota]